MNARPRRPRSRPAALMLPLALAAGCTLSQTALRRPADGPTPEASGRLVAPKRCRLDVLILTRPQGDPVLHEALWRLADEQAIEPERRRALQANGLRVGRLVGDLPPEVESLLAAGPPHGPDVQTLINPDETPARIDPSQAPARPDVTLLLSTNDPAGRAAVKGKPYKDAKAFLRLVAARSESGEAVTLQVVPELHHGPIHQNFGALPTGGLPAPMEFRLVNGQSEESFRDLSATLDLKPGEVAVLGTHPDRVGSLGDLLYQKADGASDRRLQSVVLVWAARVDAGPRAASGLAPADRPPPAALFPVDPKDFGGEAAASKP